MKYKFLAVVAALCLFIAGFSFSEIINPRQQEPTSVETETTVAEDNSSTQENDPLGDETETEAEVYVDVEKKIIGKWVNASKTVGLIFSEDTSCTIKMKDVYFPLLGVDFTGESIASYTLKEAQEGLWELTLTYNILDNVVTNTYRADIKGGLLLLTNLETGDVCVYTPFN